MTKKKGMLSAMLVLVIVFTTVFSMTASATNIFQGGQVASGGTFYTTEFSSDGNDRLTVSTTATVEWGNPTGVQLTLQKRGLFGIWSNVQTDIVPITSDPFTVWSPLVLSKNTTYRIACVCLGNGSNCATINMGIITWKAQ